MRCRSGVMDGSSANAPAVVQTSCPGAYGRRRGSDSLATLDVRRGEDQRIVLPSTAKRFSLRPVMSPGHPRNTDYWRDLTMRTCTLRFLTAATVVVLSAIMPSVGSAQHAGPKAGFNANTIVFSPDKEPLPAMLARRASDLLMRLERGAHQASDTVRRIPSRPAIESVRTSSGRQAGSSITA
jgi:hypothetical protein